MSIFSTDSLPTVRPFRPISIPTTTTLPSLTTLPIYPYVMPMINTSPKNHLDEILQVDPEEEALRRPKKRRRTKRQRLLELQAQLEQHGDGSVECQQQAEQLLEQLNRPSGRKRRRIASELVDSEKWFCPYECGKFYRKTSTRSIYEHQVECRKKMIQQRQQEKEKEVSIIPFIPTFNTMTPMFMQPTFQTFIPTPTALNIPMTHMTHMTPAMTTPLPITTPIAPALTAPMTAPLPITTPITPTPMTSVSTTPALTTSMTPTLTAPMTTPMPSISSNLTAPIPTSMSMPSMTSMNMTTSPFTRNLPMMTRMPFMPVSPLHLMRPIALTSR